MEVKRKVKRGYEDFNVSISSVIKDDKDFCQGLIAIIKKPR